MRGGLARPTARHRIVGRSAQVVLFAVVLLAGQWVLAAEFLGGEWREHRSENFRLVTDLDTPAAVERIRELEMFRSVVLQITGARVQPTSDRVEVYLVSRSRDYARLFGNRFAGFFASTLRYDRMVSGGARRGLGERQILFHEYVHYLLRTASTAHYPPWYNEGLAELLSTVHAKDGRVLIGTAPKRASTPQFVRLPISTLLHESYARWDPLESTCRHASLSIL